MCKLIVCGFPHYSQAQAAYPALLPQATNIKYKGAKVWDFSRHLWGEQIIEDRVLMAEGYKLMSGWYAEHNYSTWCIHKLTGCATGDTSCEDRHAFQKLIRGPFQPTHAMMAHWMDYLKGAPPNFKEAVLRLPHALAPRFDAAVHLRCQFKHFEYLVGPGDALWPQHEKEIMDFLHSSQVQQGLGLFEILTNEIIQQLKVTRDQLGQRRDRHRRNLRHHQDHHQVQFQRKLVDSTHPVFENINSTSNSSYLYDLIAENSIFRGDELLTDKNNNHPIRSYVYLASDNDIIKEAFASYLMSKHPEISVVRVKTGHHIAHAKDVNYLKTNDTGVFTLVMDWYSLSLANIVFAWRRDTSLLSTFAQSAQRMSGHIVSERFENPFEIPDQQLPNASTVSSTISDSLLREELEKEKEKKMTKGSQLYFKNGRAIWRQFY
jgi:hypothetical protein